MHPPLIRTERLTLRPWCEQDVDALRRHALHRLWTHRDVRCYLWDDVVISRDRAADVVQSHFASLASHGIGYWALHPLGIDDVIGFCGFRQIDDGPDLELMYGLLPEYWGRGLATEPSRAALDCLWNSTSYDRVYARTDPPNAKSVEVMRRLGMRLHSSNESMITYVLERHA